MQAPNPILPNRPGRITSWLHHAPYALAGGLLLALLLWGEKFWLTNDDIGMSMIVGGYGTAATPSPGIVLETNVIWGWLLMHVPDVAGIRGYTLATYTLLLLSCFTIFVALRRLDVPRLSAAAALVAMYAGVILYPQFTLLSGYLAVAGFALVLASDAGNLRRSMLAAAPLLLLSGLIRPDEMALVFLVSSPFLAQAWRRHSDRHWRLHWLGLACGSALLLGGASLYSLHYNSSGAWQNYEDIDSLRSEITDYGLGTYFLGHQSELKDSGLSENDVNMMRSFFFLDPKVFNSARFAPLVDSVSLIHRLQMNFGRFDKFVKVFEDPWLLTMLGMFLAVALLDKRVLIPGSLSLAIFLAAMLGISLWGRPGVVRIYTPAVAAMLMLALLTMGSRKGALTRVSGAVALILSLCICAHQALYNYRYSITQQQVRAQTCSLMPEDKLLVVWTAAKDFNWKALYRPTTRDDDPCDPALYAIDTYALSPPSLQRLYAHTGGKGFIDALMAGQSFYIIATPNYLHMLDRYLREHYQSALQWQQTQQNAVFLLYTIHAVPAATAPAE